MKFRKVSHSQVTGSSTSHKRAGPTTSAESVAWSSTLVKLLWPLTTTSFMQERKPGTFNTAKPTSFASTVKLIKFSKVKRLAFQRILHTCIRPCTKSTDKTCGVKATMTTFDLVSGVGLQNNQKDRSARSQNSSLKTLKTVAKPIVLTFLPSSLNLEWSTHNLLRELRKVSSFTRTVLKQVLDPLPLIFFR